MKLNSSIKTNTQEINTESEHREYVNIAAFVISALKNPKFETGFNFAWYKIDRY